MTDNEIVSLLKTRFGNVKRANGGWVRFKCPTCTSHDAAKLKRGLHLQTLRTHCFICEKPLELTQIFGNIPIEKPAGGDVVYEEKEHPQAREWPCKAIVPVSALPKDHPAIKFLNKDHLFDMTKLAMDFEVGFICAEDAKEIKFENSVMLAAEALVFPVYFKKEYVGWQIRFIPGTKFGDRMQKMKYLHVFHKGKYLYNYDKAKEYKSIVVVEGVKKSWKFPNGVATWGCGISEQQINLIQQWDEIAFMYDGDDKIQAKMTMLADLIELNKKKVIVIDPRNHGFLSPDEMTEAQAQEIVYKEWIKSGKMNS